MADGFDGEEIIYNMIKSCGVSVFKGPAPRDQSENHVTVIAIVTNNLEVVNVSPVAVTLFVEKPENGTMDRTTIKSLRTTIENLIASGSAPSSYYCVIDPVFSGPLESPKKGFDCHTIRYELTLNQ